MRQGRPVDTRTNPSWPVDNSVSGLKWARQIAGRDTIDVASGPYL